MTTGPQDPGAPDVTPDVAAPAPSAPRPGESAAESPAPPGRRPPTRSAAFFDLDKTIIAKSSTLAMGRPLYAGGLINRRAALRTAYAQLVFSIGGADEASMARMRRQAERMCAGWDVEKVKTIVDEALHELIDPLIYAEAAALIERHHAEGRDVVIVSSSGEEVVAGIGRMVGADHVIATRMVIRDGRYTGEVAFYAYGAAKAEAMRRLAADAGYDLASSYAYSDSATDVPMLEAVGHPTAVNPDRPLRRVAEANGWPILTFARPVRLRSRFPQVGGGRQVAIAGAAVAGAVALAWSRRRLKARPRRAEPRSRGSQIAASRVQRKAGRPARAVRA